MDWLDLLAVQRTLKSLLQHHSLRASILWLSLLYGPTFTLHMTTGKTIALTRWTFVGKVISLLFNILPRFVIGEGNGDLLQYSCLENPMVGGAWLAAVHGVSKSWTRLNDFTFTFHFSLSCTGEGNGNPLQCSCLENPRDGGAWWAAFSGVAQSRT